MKLTPPGLKGPGIRASRHAVTTTPGFCNSNRQEVLRATGARSTTHWNQSIYQLRCSLCRNEYGCNGTDIHNRRCPKCQGGVPGEPIALEADAAAFLLAARSPEAPGTTATGHTYPSTDRLAR